MSTIVFGPTTVFQDSATITVGGYPVYAQSLTSDDAQQYCFKQALKLREELIKDLLEKIGNT